MCEDIKLQRCKEVGPTGVQPKTTEYLWRHGNHSTCQITTKILRRGIIFTIS